MSDFLRDLSGIYTTGLETAAKTATHATSDRGGKSLDMQDFLTLMVTTLQNQTIDNNADISDMMNQMVQMSVVTAMNNLTDLITASTNMTYAASLVGKEVTIGQDEGRHVREITGTVTGTGMVDGQQVVFVDGKSYFMKDIMAVGRLPKDEDDAADALDDWDDLDSVDAGGAVNRGSADETDGADEADEAEYGVRDAEPLGS